MAVKVEKLLRSLYIILVGKWRSPNTNVEEGELRNGNELNEAFQNIE